MRLIANVDIGSNSLTIRSPENVSRIVAVPTASGSSAATRLRKTSSENSSRIGAASISARCRSDSTCSPTWLKATIAAADRHAGLAAQALHERVGRLVLVGRRVEGHRQVDRAAVLGDQRRRARRLAARRPPATSSSSRSSRAPPRSLRLGLRRAGLRAEPDEHDRVGRGRAPRRALDRVARLDRLRPRVGEVVARVEQPDDRAAERPGGEHDARPRRRAPPAAGGRGGGPARSSTTPSGDAGRAVAPARRPLALVGDRLEVERLRDVEQHPLREERPDGRRRRRPRAR